jgi:hypothetical protein
MMSERTGSDVLSGLRSRRATTQRQSVDMASGNHAAATTGFRREEATLRGTTFRIFKNHRPYLVLALAILVLFGLIPLHSIVRRDSVEGWTLYRPMADQPQPIDKHSTLAFLDRAASDAALRLW